MADYRALRPFTLRVKNVPKEGDVVKEGDADDREIQFLPGILRNIPADVAGHWFFEQNTEPLDDKERDDKAERLRVRAAESTGVTTWPSQPVHSDLIDPATRDPRDTRRTGDFGPQPGPQPLIGEDKVLLVGDRPQALGSGPGMTDQTMTDKGVLQPTPDAPADAKSQSKK